MSWLDPRQWLIVAAFIGASLLGYHFLGARLIGQGDAAGYARAERQHKDAADKATQDAVAKTAKLQADADQARKEKTDALQNLDRARRALADSLRNRPDRPASGGPAPTPGARQTAPGCTGAGLYRADGEFLAGEAARADTLRIELAACYTAYDRGRAVINGMTLPP